MKQRQAKDSKQRQRYPTDLTDLTDAQWAIVDAAMPPAVNGRTGGPPRYPRRELWNAICYQAKNGGTWRALPHDFPPWAAVWQQYRRWRDNGTRAAGHEALCPQVRQQAGKQPTPSAAIIASQSIRVAGKRGVRTGTTAGSGSRGASGT